MRGFGRGTVNSTIRAWSTSLLQYVDLTVDASGNLNTVSGGGGGGDTNLIEVNGVAVNIGLGTANTGTLRVAVASDSFPATQAVSAASLPLPTGASSAANQTTIIGHLDGVEGLLTTIDGDTGTLAGAVAGAEMQVDIVTSALPTGAATAARQDTTNTSLASIDSKITAVNTGAVTISAALPTGTNNIGDVDVLSLPSITGSVTANAGTNLNTSALALETTLGTRLTESDFDTKTGSLTETAPATDTASSGLNGRLQRIAQRLTSLIALFPAALVGGRFDTNTGAWLGSTAPTVGSKTSADSIPVVIASDQGAVTVTGTVSATSSADVFTADDDAGYADGELAKNLTQTQDGRLRVLSAALVSDTMESYQDGQIRSLSLNAEGRLRVSTMVANTPAYEDLVPDFSSTDTGAMWTALPGTPWT